MSRPSKKQLAERKAAAKRLKSVDNFWHKLEKACWASSFDEFEVACENCGQEQSGQNPVCVVCGGAYGVWVRATDSPTVIGSHCDFPLPHEPGAVRTISS